MIVTYVLASTGCDRYATMCFLSASALRRVHPEVRTVLVCDERTSVHLRANAPFLERVIDEFVIEPAPMPHPRSRSFYLKTRLRSIITGDFIFLDCDTLPVRPFLDMTAGDWDMAFVLDRSHHGPIDPVFPHWEVPRLKRMAWNARLTRYFNTGVGYYRDNAAVRALATEWQRLWEQAYAQGDDWDQLAFNCAAEAVPVRIHELPVSYNAMVAVSPLHAREAKIYHFFAGNQTEMSDSLYEHLIHYFESSGKVDWAAIDRSVATNHPWMPPYWPRRLWQTGNRVQAVRLALTNLPRRLTRIALPHRAAAR